MDITATNYMYWYMALVAMENANCLKGNSLHKQYDINAKGMLASKSVPVACWTS